MSVAPHRSASWTGPSPSIIAISALFLIAGTAHFLVPQRYAAIVPPWLPHPLALVYVSGVAELAGGVGVLLRRWRRAAGTGLSLLLFAVFPANLQMLLNAIAAGKAAWYVAGLILRLPLQGVLIWWIRRSTVRT